MNANLEAASSAESSDVLSRAHSFAELQLGRLIIHKELGWSAVPYPPGWGDFDDREWNCLAELARRAGTETLWLVTDDPGVFRVTPDANVLRQLPDRFPLYNIVFLPASFAWYVLASEAAFSVVIGDPLDVTAFAGGEPEAAIEIFRDSLADWQRVPPLIEAIANAPWVDYTNLPSGSTFEITWPTS